MPAEREYRVLIAHPTRQHSHQLARELSGFGLLDGYLSLLPGSCFFGVISNRWPSAIPAVLRRHELSYLPESKKAFFIGPLLIQKLCSFSGRLRVRQFGQLLTWTLFDWWAAWRLSRHRPDVVVGYEMCCRRTFSIAKRLGVLCVLDAAAVHYSLQLAILPEEQIAAKTKFGRNLIARKQAEIESADLILCCSKLALESFLDAGVSGCKIRHSTLGYDKNIFFLPHGGFPVDGPARFCFVGTAGYHKGADILVSAFKKLRTEYPLIELVFVGDSNKAGDFSATEDGITILGKRDQRGVQRLLSQIDCLVLPSRLESFGMVVLEALACGVWVIVSDHAGSYELINSGTNGAIFQSEDVEQLLSRMHYVCDALGKIRAGRANRARTPPSLSWSEYGRRSRHYLGSALVEFRQRASCQSR